MSKTFNRSTDEDFQDDMRADANAERTGDKQREYDNWLASEQIAHPSWSVADILENAREYEEEKKWRMK